MCSVNSCDSELLMNPKKSTLKLENFSICKKCSVNKPTILLRGKDAYCIDCFLIAATHKFRASLGKSKIIRPNDRVLVAHSGKAGSTALLHLIKAGMQESVHKRLVFKTQVLHIDENVLYQNQPESMILKSCICDQVKDIGFSGHFTTLSQIFNPVEPHIEPFESNVILTEYDEKLINMFKSLSDESSKEDLLSKLRQQLIVAIARKLNCNKVFFGDDMTSLSIKILQNISLGRAAHLSLDVSFSDLRYSDLILLRPMKDFSKEELFVYLEYYKLPIYGSTNVSNAKDNYTSIKRLTEKFVTDLDNESNSTVSTIYRIGEKLSPYSGNKQNLKEENICILCEAMLDTATDNQTLCTIRATEFSKVVSEGKNSGINNENEKKKIGIAEKCNSECNCTTNSLKKCNNVLETRQILSFFCYGCQLIIKEFKSIECFPDILYEKILKKVSLEKMRSEIDHFLL